MDADALRCPLRLVERLSPACPPAGRPRGHDVRVVSNDDFIDLDRPRLRPSRTHHGFEHLRLLAEQLATEARLASPQVTVDFGCGAMPYRPLFAGRYIGIDLTNSHGHPDALAWAEATPLRDRCADVVISTQQLEHVADPRAVLAEARRVLRPEGTLLLSTHGVWPYHPDPHDLWRWTEEGLKDIVSAVGFDVERVHHQGELYTSALLLATYPLGGLRRRAPRALRFLAGALLAVANTLCRPLDRLATGTGLRHYASPSYLIVARRRA